MNKKYIVNIDKSIWIYYFDQGGFLGWKFRRLFDWSF